MSEAKQFEKVYVRPAEFPHVRIDVTPWSYAHQPGVQGHTVGIMDEHSGRGTRGSLEYAEAEAKAVLKAIRSYRRKNAALLTETPNRGNGAQEES